MKSDDKNSNKYTHLTDEEKKRLDEMKKEWEERKKISPEKRVPVPNQDKYKDPIGINDEGKPFPVE